ncbi:EAL domain-containing protein [Aureimonas populi]|uniref:EAL domain-containing protein n=1 Tax=Aureimonas populi TaxID=1701758 RepID=A0ABW5CJV1_9HYPH|nr:EAL domain-containing protein [Aureimonas populi]
MKQLLTAIFHSRASVSIACITAAASLGVSDLLHGYGPDARIGLIAVGLLLSAVALGTIIANQIQTAWQDEQIAELERQRVHEASYDHATGALTRRCFLEACEQAVRTASPERPLGYFAVDMDYLKILNDSLGHEVGDGALRRLVQAMGRAGDDIIIGRLGGDEFAFLLPCADEREAYAVAASFLKDIRKASVLRGSEITLSATIGIALIPSHTSFLSEALQFSDLALYEGKRAGRGQATLFTPRMLGEFRRERQIERELKLGLEKDELRQFYQPIHDASGRIIAARALLQWDSSWLGPVPAETFIPVASMTTLIDRVGEWSFRRACEDARSFENLTVSIPVSLGQLKRERIVHMVRKVREEASIAMNRVVLVLEQTATRVGHQDVERRLHRLRELGVRISLDDLSTIVCDFERLRDFPTDIVRIKQQQIARLGKSETDNVVVSALASVAAALGLPIVADGVASEEQFVLARTAGCSMFTGPYFSDAMTAQELRARLPQACADKRATAKEEA